ncbi:MAG: hypothetical protein CVU06_08040 [Bacteroidetes bacterium HGW-Bacteroidetes-22]|nr:MAG: hypothetical protein CVU06_08040 [Bacteroidetes bacterium HGW-Bacteroidetes-22]
MQKSEKKHIIILSTYFPPIVSVASNRIFAFAEYLNKDRFSVDVVTLMEHHKTAKFENFNVTYLPNRQIIKRAGFYRNYPYLVHKSRALWNFLISILGIREYRGWGEAAIRAAGKLIKNPSETVLITSFPVDEVLHVAIALKQKYPLMTWISDLRDGLSTNPYHSEKVAQKYLQLEKKMMQMANGITSVSDPLINYFHHHPSELSVPIVEIRNGYNFDAGSPAQFNDHFTISHVGTFYGDRNPGFFFRAIHELQEAGLVPDICIQFVGVSGGVVIPVKLKPVVIIHEKVGYENAIEIMRRSDALLLVLPAGRFKGVYSGKLFDYLGVMKPIVALVDKDDVAASLVMDCKAGAIAGWNSVTEIKKAILWAYEIWKEKRVPEYNRELIEQHHRKVQVQSLEVFIEYLLKK